MLLKVLFWFFATSYALLLAVTSLTIQWSTVDWLGNAVLVIWFVAFYGLAYRKQIWSKNIWRAVIGISVIYWVIYTFYLDPRFGAYPPKTPDEFIVTLIGGVVPLIAAAVYTMQLKR